MSAITTVSEQENYVTPGWTRMVAQVLSYLFHPLFIPVYIAWLLLFRHPINQLLVDDPMRLRLFAMVSINTVLFPGILVFLLWRLKFIENLQMETRRERIIPLVASILFYFWGFYVSRNIELVPHALLQWLLGVFLTSCAAMFTNIFFKVSLHSLGVGGAIAFSLIQAYTDPYWPQSWAIMILIIGGMVGTARLLRGAHQPGEVYAGYIAGAICQLAAMLIA